MFSSINLGTCVKPGGRLATKALLKAIDDGIGKGVTSLFPIVIFKLKEGVTYSPQDPNYDLRLYSERVTAKRMFPNYSNLDAPYNLKYYKEGHPETEAAYMGCLARHEQVIIKVNNDVRLMSIGNAYEYFEDSDVATADTSKSKYIDLDGMQVSVYDSNKQSFVRCKGILKNPDKRDWKRIVLSDGRLLLATSDHPLPVKNKGRTQVNALKVGDEIPAVWTAPEVDIKKSVSTEEAWLLGLILCDGCYASSINISLGLDEYDILKTAQTALADCWHLDTKVTKRMRGEKGDYYDLYVTGNQVTQRNALLKSFGSLKKSERHLPEDILTWNRKARLAFLAGMIDADGYVNKVKKGSGIANRVQIGSTNPGLALQQMYLAQSLGYPAKVYINHYAKGVSSVRYKVEFGATIELVEMLKSSKKRKWTEDDYTSAIQTPEYVSVRSIEDADDYIGSSYDFETDSDRFDASGINSHNCRTRAISNVNGPEIVTDRGNLSFTTLNLPRYAIEASREGTSEEERIEIFFKKLDKYLDIARRQLEHRYKIQCNRRVYNLPYVMQQGAYMGSEHLSPDDTIRKAIENGTLSFGFVGLAEALVALTGHDHTEGEQYQQLGLRIVKHMRDYADKLTEEQHMNWSLIATPAESVAGKMLRKDRAEFGVIPGVTDKDYYTNSNHVPVWRKIRASEKIRLEAPYHELTNAGCYMARFKQGERKSKRCAA